MTSQFKNRLVGITILVALVVIFLPSIIDGEKTSYQQDFVKTPIKPNLKEHSNEFQVISVAQDENVIVEDTLEINTTKNIESAPVEWKVEEIAEAVDTGKTVVQEVTKKQTTNSSNKIIFNDPAWTIQLGAFQNKKNINTLIKKLNKAGFQVHTIPREVMEGQLTRVFVGPDVSKKILEEKLPRLKRLTNLNGKLVPFNPIEP